MADEQEKDGVGNEHVYNCFDTYYYHYFVATLTHIEDSGSLESAIEREPNALQLYYGLVVVNM
mgnify:CR=1 FL=1|jgi:hypothetical protein